MLLKVYTTVFPANVWLLASAHGLAALQELITVLNELITSVSVDSLFCVRERPYPELDVSHSYSELVQAASAMTAACSTDSEAVHQSMLQISQPLLDALHRYAYSNASPDMLQDSRGSRGGFCRGYSTCHRTN